MDGQMSAQTDRVRLCKGKLETDVAQVTKSWFTIHKAPGSVPNPVGKKIVGLLCA